MATAGGGIGQLVVPGGAVFRYDGAMYRFGGFVLLWMTAALPLAAADVSPSTMTDLATGARMEGHGAVGVAPTEAQAEAAFEAARKDFLAVAAGSAPATRLGDVVQPVGNGDAQVAGGVPHNVSLEEIRLVLDVDNVTLREVMAKIVEQGAAYSGPWTVKWRLKPENMDLMDERVNLTAEAKFGEFCALLTERVKNMTGVQLFVTAFAGSRILLVTDTYY